MFPRGLTRALEQQAAGQTVMTVHRGGHLPPGGAPPSPHHHGDPGGRSPAGVAGVTTCPRDGGRAYPSGPPSAGQLLPRWRGEACRGGGRGGQRAASPPPFPFYGCRGQLWGATAPGCQERAPLPPTPPPTPTPHPCPRGNVATLRRVTCSGAPANSVATRRRRRHGRATIKPRRHVVCPSEY